MLCNAQDTLRYPINAMKGIRIGFDASKLLFPLIYNGERKGFEVTVDKFIKGDVFATLEAGWLKVNLDRQPDYIYTGNGLYGKLGVDLNLLKSRVPDSNDIIYGGVRYAYSKFSHQADNIKVPGHFWPDATDMFIPKKNMTAHWLEILFGVKAEVIDNLYINLTFRFKFLIVPPKDNLSTPYLIPGYGKGNSEFELGINYYVSYNIRF